MLETVESRTSSKIPNFGIQIPGHAFIGQKLIIISLSFLKIKIFSNRKFK